MEIVIIKDRKTKMQGGQPWNGASSRHEDENTGRESAERVTIKGFG
jgi:hypothetical protein